MAARGRSAARFARRLYPVALAAWERWQRMSPEEKERYRNMARDYARRGRAAADRRRESLARRRTRRHGR
jgi:hypothetical protein